MFSHTLHGTSWSRWKLNRYWRKSLLQFKFLMAVSNIMNLEFWNPTTNQNSIHFLSIYGMLYPWRVLMWWWYLVGKNICTWLLHAQLHTPWGKKKSLHLNAWHCNPNTNAKHLMALRPLQAQGRRGLSENGVRPQFQNIIINLNQVSPYQCYVIDVHHFPTRHKIIKPIPALRRWAPHGFHRVSRPISPWIKGNLQQLRSFRNGTAHSKSNRGVVLVQGKREQH